MYILFLFWLVVFDERKFGSFILGFSLEMSRKSITLYDDQYKFFKVFNSPNLLIAFVEYMFDDKEPEWLNEQEQILFESLRIRMDNQKKKSVAWSLSHWWWRPEKTTEEKSKKQQKNNRKTTQKQQKNNKKTTEKQQVKDKDISRSISISRNDNISISNDIETESKDSEYWNQDINLCLKLIWKYSGWIIDWTKQQQRRYSKLLIDKLKNLDSIKSGKYTWYDTLEIILKVISQNKYHSSKITSPEKIYRNLAVLMQQCRADVSKANTNSTVLQVV